MEPLESSPCFLSTRRILYHSVTLNVCHPSGYVSLIHLGTLIFSTVLSLIVPDATLLLVTKVAFLHKPQVALQIDCTLEEEQLCRTQALGPLLFREAGPNNSRTFCFQNCSECKEKRAAHILCTYCNRWLCSSCTEEHQHGPAPGGPLFPPAQKGSPGITAGSSH